jgi:hypothetical protein
MVVLIENSSIKLYYFNILHLRISHPTIEQNITRKVRRARITKTNPAMTSKVGVIKLGVFMLFT